MMRRKKTLPAQQGFTMMELLLVVSIVLILGAVAVPSYMEQRLRVSEAAAVFNLDMMSKAQKQFKLDNQWGNYASGGQEGELQSYIDFSEDDGSWQYRIVSGDANGFVLEADHQATLGPNQRVLRMDQDGYIERSRDNGATWEDY